MFYIGVDIGGTSIKGGAVNEKGQVQSTFVMPFKNSDSSDVTLANLIKTIKKYINDNKIDLKKIKGIGVGCPGAIDSINGVVTFANNLKWNNVKLKEILEKGLHIPVKITNDANAAALGEAKFGAGKIYPNVILLTLGTGIGGGIIIDEKLYEGNEGKGAELGHTVIVVDGEKCTCGRRGCFETYASATALIKQSKKIMKQYPKSLMWKLVDGKINNVNGKVAFDASKKDDKAGKLIVDWYVKYLSEGILNFCNIFRPNIVILSGGIANQGEYLLKKIRKYCKEHNYGYPRSPKVEIQKAVLGYESGIIGAACLFI